MSLLGGALRVDAESHAASRSFHLRPVFPELEGRIKHDMVTVPDDLIHLVCPVRRREDMVLLPHLLIAQPRLIKSAGRRPVQILPDPGIQRIHGKRLLRQKNMTSRLLLDPLQDFQILPYLPLLHHETRRLKFPSLHNPLPSNLQFPPAKLPCRVFSADLFARFPFDEADRSGVLIKDRSRTPALRARPLRS